MHTWHPPHVLTMLTRMPNRVTELRTAAAACRQQLRQRTALTPQQPWLTSLFTTLTITSSGQFITCGMGRWHSDHTQPVFILARGSSRKPGAAPHSAAQQDHALVRLNSRRANDAACGRRSLSPLRTLSAT